MGEEEEGKGVVGVEKGEEGRGGEEAAKSPAGGAEGEDGAEGEEGDDALQKLVRQTPPYGRLHHHFLLLVAVVLSSLLSSSQHHRLLLLLLLQDTTKIPSLTAAGLQGAIFTARNGRSALSIAFGLHMTEQRRSLWALRGLQSSSSFWNRKSKKASIVGK